jgi:hypothetical protein
MNKLIGVSIFLLSITAFAQTDLSPVSCGTLDAIACNELQKKETARINKENQSKLVEAFKNCSPLKSPVYLLTKLMRTTIIDGKIGDKCKVIIAQSSVPAQQVCLFDQKAMSLISKDPQTYTQEEQILSSTLFNQQCKNEIIGESKEAIEMRKINKEIEENMDDLK